MYYKGIAQHVEVEEYGWKLKNDTLVPQMTDNLPALQNVLKLIRCGCKTGCKSMLCAKSANSELEESDDVSLDRLSCILF